jgi:hypothetical protein
MPAEAFAALWFSSTTTNNLVGAAIAVLVLGAAAPMPAADDRTGSAVLDAAAEDGLASALGAPVTRLSAASSSAVAAYR